MHLAAHLGATNECYDIRTHPVAVWPKPCFSVVFVSRLAALIHVGPFIYDVGRRVSSVSRKT